MDITLLFKSEIFHYIQLSISCSKKEGCLTIVIYGCERAVCLVYDVLQQFNVAVLSSQVESSLTLIINEAWAALYLMKEVLDNW